MRNKNKTIHVKQLMPFYLMILPGFLFFIIFKYVPMLGNVIAFQNYNPFQGFMRSPWVGLDNFQKLFTTPDFWPLLRNTLWLGALQIVFYFPVPIALALLLNEVGSRRFKKWTQTIYYAPHFLSWVVIVGITVVLFSSQSGGVNEMLQSLGWHRLQVLTTPIGFRVVWILQNIWQGAGWGAIIFLAALSGVDPNLYEAAVMDGANRWQQVGYITLPAIRSVVVILFILRLGEFIEIGFEHVYLLQNTLNLSTSDIFDTYVYRNGILKGNFSYTTTVGLFKSLIGLLLVVGANQLAKRFGEEGVF